MDFLHADDDMLNELTRTSAPNAGVRDHGGHSAHSMHGSSNGSPSDIHSAHSMGGHGGGEHTMAMFFHLGYQETVLFSFWTINSVGGLVGSMIGLFLASMLYEGLKVFREYLLQRALVCERDHPGSTDRSNSNSNVLRVPLAAENGDSPDGSASINAPVKGSLLRPHPFSAMHLFQSFLHMFQVFISYLLMLVFMTYNVWLSLAVVLGAGAGYFLFGWRKKTIVDINEHCH